MKKRFISFLLILITIFGITFEGDYIKVSANIDRSTALMYGIDVSRYQKDIDWAQVKASGVQFAIIRVGTAKYGLDAKFLKNITEANAVGIKCGIYIYSYAHSVEEAAQEAMLVLSAIEPYTISMPVCIDIEDDIQKTISPEVQAQMANTFCSIIEAAGYYPLVYGSKSWFKNRMAPIAYEKWVAQYNSYCAIDDAVIWQASCTGRVPGISTDVDLDYAYKDFSSLIIANGFQYRKGYYYYYENYKMKKNAFIPVNGIGMYYVDEFGHMTTGLKTIGTGIFYFNNAGLMQLGLQNIGGKNYYFGNDGQMVFGLQNIGGQIYYFGNDGAMFNGGFINFDAPHYFYADGHMATGLSKIGNDYYYFDGTGKMTTGLVPAGNDFMYFDPATGKMLTGFVNIGANTYYFDPATGLMARGFVKVGNYTYFFDQADGHLWVNAQVPGITEIYVIDVNGHVTIVPLAG